MNYIMTNEDWTAAVISLLPDFYEKSNHGTKEDIAFNLSVRFGTFNGLLSSGWYPDEAVEDFVDEEFDDGLIDKVTFLEAENKIRQYQNKSK